MKCCSRSTLGVVIGIINVLAYVCVFIFVVTHLIKLNTRGIDNNNLHYDAAKDDNEIANTILSIILVVSVVMTAVSILFIIGIVKRRHLLMAPWLAIAVFSLICSCIRLVISFIRAISINISIAFITLLIGFLIIGLNVLILYKIYTLYVDISDENRKRSKRITTERQMGISNPYPEQPTY